MPDKKSIDKKEREGGKKGIKKGTIPPRYDKAFQEGANRLVTEQGRPSREVAEELGISVDRQRHVERGYDIDKQEVIYKKPLL